VVDLEHMQHNQKSVPLHMRDQQQAAVPISVSA
jgi:hypothetical protein